MGMRRDRHSDWALRDRRWPALRLQAKRRDKWRCVECGAAGRLEVHHVRRVKDYPELAFALDNLKTLCARCHSKETRIECGLAVELDPARQAWKTLILDLQQRKDKLCFSL